MTGMAGHGTVEYAEALEADALAYPDERSELLLESVSAWRRAGHPGRAREIADGLVADGGDDGCFARVERVELSLDESDWTSARAELAELARQPDLDQHHCLMAAELLVERDATELGLAWFDWAVARLSEDDLATLTGPAAGSSATMILVRQRRDLRERLGIPGPRPTHSPYPHQASPTFSRHRRPPPVPPFRRRLAPAPDARVPSPERAEARRRWPDVYDATDDEYYPAVELGWRDLREDGAATIQGRACVRGGTGRLR